MTTIDTITAAHGHTGPTVCQECGTTELVHFGSWFDPETGDSGSFLLCCLCGLKAGDPVEAHHDCGAPVMRYLLNDLTDPHSEFAYKRVLAKAAEAYERGRHTAVHILALEGREAQERALETVLGEIGRSYAAAALNQAMRVLAGKVDEETCASLGDIAAALDLGVVEDLDGANGLGEEEASAVRVFRAEDGWSLAPSQPREACTSNHDREQQGRPLCAETAVWKVVEFGDTGATISFWCDTDLPAKYRPTATAA